MKIKTFLLATLTVISFNVKSQTLYVPSGTSGIGTSTTANVGIGISNPAEKLHISGAIRGSVNGALKISTGSGYVDIGPQSASMTNFNTDRPFFCFNKPIYLVDGKLSSYSTSNLYLMTGGTTRMTIDPSNITINGDLKFPSTNNIEFGFNSTYSKLRIGTNQQFHHVYLDYKENFYFRLWDNVSYSSLVLESSGNVGIGFNTSYTPGQTHTQGYKLAVNGGILCEEVKVIADVPNADYVFDSTYSLKSLAEVEAFINKNKHLPDIPSATQFKTEGYKIGDMDEMLLRKVEELTLYIIELQKQIQDLKSKGESK